MINAVKEKSRLILWAGGWHSKETEGSPKIHMKG